MTKKTEPDIVLGETTTRLLACKLTNDELLKMGGDLGTVIQDIAEEEDRQASMKQELKARLAQLEAQRTELATKICRREEMRMVEVQEEKNFKTKMYGVIRKDTGELINQRPLLQGEYQEKLV